MAEGHDICDNQTEAPGASGSPLLPRRCSSSQTLLPVESPLRPPWPDPHSEQDDFPTRMPSSRLYEELFCAGQTSIPLAPLVGAFMAASAPRSDVVKQGYLGRLEQNHKRYFVLRTGSHIGPSRLEWYKSQEKFTAMEKSAGKASLFGSNKQGVIYLRCCLGVSRIGNSRKGHTVALYAKDQTMVLVMEDQQQNEDWYVAIKMLMEEEQKDEEHDGLNEEDDGYCTLPSVAFFKEVWPVTVKPRGLGSSKPLTGENRLCLTATSLVLVRLGASNDLPSVTIPLLSVRRFGHLDGSFFLELGRSAPNGPGEIWMEARQQGNPAMAQNIHEAVREAVRALRALPDYSRSPNSSHNHPSGLMASKRCRPKSREKLMNARPLGPLVLHRRNSESQTSPETRLESSPMFSSHLSPSRPQQSSEPETGSSVGTGRNTCRAAGGRMQSWESTEDEEGQGYMIMSPNVSHNSSGISQDDYVVMESPQKYNREAYSSSSSSSLQTSFSSFACDSFSSLHHLQYLRTSVQQSETEDGQSQTSTSCSAQPQDDPQQEEKSAGTRTAPPFEWSVLVAPFALSGSGGRRPPESRQDLDTGQSGRLEAVPDQPAIRRYWLSGCLFSCLQGENKN
ncbi:insulin receptor substrate 2-A-like [Cololabis saira]|uniref:insulin receptor substrate 2-A-like n=1 Tax=Cololabis saira TaxID=129043 RepID=UPI002AD1F524|nr:insulin receptor substrate 2-A-like [Cololabis saira]